MELSAHTTLSFKGFDEIFIPTLSGGHRNLAATAFPTISLDPAEKETASKCGSCSRSEEKNAVETKGGRMSQKSHSFFLSNLSNLGPTMEERNTLEIETNEAGSVDVADTKAMLAAENPAATLISVKITGFKSFQEPETIIISRAFPSTTVGDNRKNLICICGPNGAGKSSVVESIAFVLGAKVSRTLEWRGWWRESDLSVKILNAFVDPLCL
jgi:hypothetical protein